MNNGTTAVDVTPAGRLTNVEPDPRRWWSLAVIAVAQLMIVLDGARRRRRPALGPATLDISTANRQWVLSAYTLAFGSLLLLGGRIADYLGRRRMFIVGLVGFGAASALGGLAQDAAMLFGARALQGAFAALMAPASLSLLTTTFTEVRERARAFGIYGAIAGGGAAIGLVLGGTLTQLASWRWTLLINAPIAVVAVLGALRFVQESRVHARAGYDIPGAVSVTGGFFFLVYGFTTAGTDGWTAPLTLGLLAAAAAAPLCLPRDRVALDTPAVADASRPRPQPGRVLPGLVARGQRLAGDLPVPYLLPPGDVAVLGPQDGVRLPALLRGDHRRSRPGHEAASPHRPTGTDGGRLGPGSRWFDVVHRLERRQHLPGPCPAAATAGQHRHGADLRPDVLDRLDRGRSDRRRGSQCAGQHDSAGRRVARYCSFEHRRRVSGRGESYPATHARAAKAVQSAPPSMATQRPSP